MEAGGQDLVREEENIRENTPNGEAKGKNNTTDSEETPERKITQTDHLNKRLLDSFLSRLNQPNSGIPSVERIDCDDDVDQPKVEGHHPQAIPSDSAPVSFPKLIIPYETRISPPLRQSAPHT